MIKYSIVFLRGIVVTVAVFAAFLLLRFPLLEGRATNLDLISIYFDPFILYSYASSITFFVALYKTFKFLGYVQGEAVFSVASLNTVKYIKYCAIIQGLLIGLAGLIIRLTHHKEDDPAGFLAICTVAVFVSVVVAVSVGVFEHILQKGAKEINYTV